MTFKDVNLPSLELTYIHPYIPVPYIHTYIHGLDGDEPTLLEMGVVSHLSIRPSIHPLPHNWCWSTTWLSGGWQVTGC